LKRKAIGVLTILLLLIAVNPVMASVNLNVNGKPYTPAVSAQVQEGITTVPLNFIGRTLGADVTVDENQVITIKENENTLTLNVGSLNASYNGQSKVMPCAPEVINGEIMVPLRFIMEAFAAEVTWQGDDQTVAVQYQEKRDGMTVEEMLAQTSAAMEEYNTYKAKVDLQMSSIVKAQNEEPQVIDMTGKLNMAYQQKPLLIYIQQEMSGSTGQEKIDKVTTESLINKDGFYMTVPDQGWVKMEIPGMDISTLLEQSGNQNVIDSIQQMKDAGVVMSYANDQVKDDKEYWVINVTMGPESFKKYYDNLMKQIPELNSAASGTANPLDTIQNSLNELFKGLEADMVYSVWIDKDSKLTKFMDLDADINMNMKVPDENQKMTEFNMKMNEKADYELYDFGAAFDVPDVSGAISMNDYMNDYMKQQEQQ
jgi:hypothetical protein